MRSSHLWPRPGLASHPRPRGQRTSEGERAPLSGSSCHETRTPESGKAFGPGPPASPRKGHGPLLFQTFPYSCPLKGPSRWLGYTGCHPHVLKAGFLDAEREVTSRIPYPFWFAIWGKGVQTKLSPSPLK